MPCSVSMSSFIFFYGVSSCPLIPSTKGMRGQEDGLSACIHRSTIECRCYFEWLFLLVAVQKNILKYGFSHNLGRR